MIKRTALSFALLLLCFTAIAQRMNFDSLIDVALKNRYKIKAVTTPNRDSLFKLLPSNQNPHDRIRLIFKITGNGLDFARQGLIYHYKILQWAKANKDKVSETVITAELGYNLYQNGDNTSALRVILQALRLGEETGNDQALGIVYRDLSLCSPPDDKLIKTYLFKGLYYSQAAHDDLYTINSLQGLGRRYYAEQMPDSGRYYLYQALLLSTRVNVPEYTCATIAYIAAEEKDKAVKLKYFRARAMIAISSGNAGTISHAYDGLSDYFQKNNQPDSGLYYARKAYEYSSSLSFASQIRPVLLMAKLYDGRNTDSALKYTKLYNTLHDSTSNINKLQNAMALAFDEQQRKQEAQSQKESFQNRQRLLILIVVIAFLITLAMILLRNNRQKQKANKVLEETLAELKSAQAQLIQAEKMASLGELTAGIAHEIQNPLNFVNNFSEVSQELMEELKEELDRGDTEEAKFIASDVIENLGKIHHHGKRADSIVKGMLEHSRASTGIKELTDINKLADEYLRLAYHGLRAKDKSFNAELITHFDETLPLVKVIPQDMGRVLLNLFNNSFYAVHQKQKTAGNNYKPLVEVSTFTPPSGGWGAVVRDNGNGIPDAIKDKIMQPFFTTKPTGEGTGLGLSLSYDIVVKGHGGTIQVESTEGEGSRFIISLPIS